MSTVQERGEGERARASLWAHGVSVDCGDGDVRVGSTLGRVGIASHPTHRFDLQDLLDLPDDGYQYEVIDGALVVNAAPSWRHQEVVARLLDLLRPAAPAGVLVLPSPAWRLDEGQVPQPDVVVVSSACLGEHAVEGVPLLVVEVLSPGNRGADLVRKRALYADAGCPSYWIVDPAEPSVLLLTLDEGQYVERARIVGDETVTLVEPVPTTIRPIDLVRG